MSKEPKFDVSIYLEGGHVIRERFTSFSVKKNALGELSEISWTFVNPGTQMLQLNIDKVIAVVSKEI